MLHGATFDVKLIGHRPAGWLLTCFTVWDACFCKLKRNFFFACVNFFSMCSQTGRKLRFTLVLLYTSSKAQHDKFTLSPDILSGELKVFITSKMENLFVSYTAYRQLCQMIFAILFFHTSEYFLAISFHGKSNVPLASLLISKQYVLAMAFSILEYILEISFFPRMKDYWWLSNVGLGLVLIGEVIRKLAIITAGYSFTHMIRTRHDEQHQLITHGIYRFMRHPGYCGFFIWAIGIQIMILNPLCTAAFTLILWRFFSGRIIYEEYFLRQFFGSRYEEYAQEVLSGVPFVK